MSSTMQNAQGLNLRAKVIQTLLQVEQGQSLSQILNTQLQQIAPQDKGLFHELLLGTLRQWFALKSLALPLLNKELNTPTVETCLYVGLYQIFYTRIAQHAIISETVEACKQLGYEGLSGVVNAILRKATREMAHFQQILEQAHGLPSWLYKRLNKDWGEQSQDLFYQLKQTAPLTLRVNRRKMSRSEYLAHLQEQNIPAQACQYSPDAIYILGNVHIPSLVGFDEGWFSVQDEHAQLSAYILPDLTNKSVLDACAAPGGKTTHLLEKYQLKQLIALDNDDSRLNRVRENLQRLQLSQENLRIVTADASEWQADETVDCIVLDAPCSATGVIRRHPDIRLLRQSQDIVQIVALQQAILDNMWQQLKVGGSLLYITCSILKAENEQQMADFFSRHSNAEEQKIDSSWGIEQRYGKQLLPKQNQGDGFYYCLIKKTA